MEAAGINIALGARMQHQLHGSSNRNPAGFVMKFVWVCFHIDPAMVWLQVTYSLATGWEKIDHLLMVLASGSLSHICLKLFGPFFAVPFFGGGMRHCLQDPLWSYRYCFFQQDSPIMTGQPIPPRPSSTALKNKGLIGGLIFCETNGLK